MNLSGVILLLSLLLAPGASAVAPVTSAKGIRHLDRRAGQDRPAPLVSNSTGSGMPGSKRRTWRFAAYCTGHGLGHKTRVVELCRALLARGHDVVVCSLPPNFIFTQELGPGVRVREVERPLDVGGVQLDALSVDVDATLEKYHEEVHCRREELISAEADWLESAGIDCVLVDSPAVACAAAKRANRPAVAITNLVWSDVYRDYLLALKDGGSAELRARYRSMLDQISEDYACATALLRLPGYSPMPAFRRCRHVMDMPLVVRRAKKARDAVRKEHGLPQDAKLVLVTFGGQQADWDLKDEYLPPGWLGLVTIGPKDLLSRGPLPSRYRAISPDVFMPDLINAVDVVLGKIGYGTVSEILAHRVPLVYVPRLHWNEQNYLLKLMQRHGTPIEMPKQDFEAGRWAPYLEAAYRLPRANNRRAYRGPKDAAAVVVGALEKILQEEAERSARARGREEDKASAPT